LKEARDVSRRLLRLRAVEAKTGLRHSAIYQRMAAGNFPKQLQISGRYAAWVEDEIDAWIEVQIAARDAGKPLIPTNAAKKKAREEAEALAATFDGTA
jgi:prophage regulatory protein